MGEMLLPVATIYFVVQLCHTRIRTRDFSRLRDGMEGGDCILCRHGGIASDCRPCFPGPPSPWPLRSGPRPTRAPSCHPRHLRRRGYVHVLGRDDQTLCSGRNPLHPLGGGGGAAAAAWRSRMKAPASWIAQAKTEAPAATQEARRQHFASAGRRAIVAGTTPARCRARHHLGRTWRCLRISRDSSTTLAAAKSVIKSLMMKRFAY